MDKGTITIELPILDDVDQMEVVNTFNKKQLWYVCAIAKAFEKSQQELQRKDNIINEIKNIINRMIYDGYTLGKDNAFIFMATGENSEFGTRAKYILNKIKELEKSK